MAREHSIGPLLPLLHVRAWGWQRRPLLARGVGIGSSRDREGADPIERFRCLLPAPDWTLRAHDVDGERSIGPLAGARGCWRLRLLAANRLRSNDRCRMPEGRIGCTRGGVRVHQGKGLFPPGKHRGMAGMGRALRRHGACCIGGHANRSPRALEVGCPLVGARVWHRVERMRAGRRLRSCEHGRRHGVG
ncbi:Hypothetical protein A7982_08828 [Minicystis rosea]|nr:Hypothetical protein A7982_08828 [Minicystis rosea]